MGKAVAEKVATRLDYDLVCREILLDASSRFNISEIKLEKAIHDAPGILERYRHSKQSYIAYFRAALMERVATDNIVYHGLGGHLLLLGVPHVLKIRITADCETRVRNEMERENISEQEARMRLWEDDKQRRKWTRSLYGVDPWNSSLYDLTICIDKISIEQAVDFICQAVLTPAFRQTENTIQKVKDLSIACRIKAELVDDFPNIGVVCEYGNVLIYSHHISGKLLKRLKKIQSDMSEVFNLETHAGVQAPSDAV